MNDVCLCDTSCVLAQLRAWSQRHSDEIAAAIWRTLEPSPMIQKILREERVQVSETVLGTFFFKHVAEDFLREKKQDYPGRVVELREVLWSKARRYHVVLILGGDPWASGQRTGS